MINIQYNYYSEYFEARLKDNTEIVGYGKTKELAWINLYYKVDKVWVMV